MHFIRYITRRVSNAITRKRLRRRRHRSARTVGAPGHIGAPSIGQRSIERRKFRKLFFSMSGFSPPNHTPRIPSPIWRKRKRSIVLASHPTMRVVS
jgi:hypothetical protein